MTSYEQMLEENFNPSFNLQEKEVIRRRRELKA
jgi:hypothetical protein